MTALYTQLFKLRLLVCKKCASTECIKACCYLHFLDLRTNLQNLIIADDHMLPTSRHTGNNTEICLEYSTESTSLLKSVDKKACNVALYAFVQ